MNTLTLKNICQQSRVIGNGKAPGFRVQLSLQPFSDDMIDMITHEELFATEAEAERLRDAIRARGVINLEHWVWVPSQATAIRPLQSPPTATLKPEFYVPKF